MNQDEPNIKLWMYPFQWYYEFWILPESNLNPDGYPKKIQENNILNSDSILNKYTKILMNPNNFSNK